MDKINLDFWLIFGLLGQFVFFLRFFLQWIVSEIKKRSTIPDVF
ncbi:MAG: lipid-A-disaccharide synthase N-terminal domain-containing protein [Myxococcota bacterium]